MTRRNQTGTDLWQDIPRGGSSWSKLPEATTSLVCFWNRKKVGVAVVQ